MIFSLDKVAVFTVIFPENMPMFNDYLVALEKQSFTNFDLLIFNDGVVNLEQKISWLSLKNVIIVNLSGSQALIRTQIFEYLKCSDYLYAIAGDSDDYFSEKRIEENLLILKNGVDVVVDDVCLVDQNKALLIDRYFSSRLKNGQLIGLEFIKQKNVCGLGNTSFIISSIPENIYFNQDVVAIDWLFYTRMLLENKSIVFNSKSKVYYRQHENNSIGFDKISDERILKSIKTKLKHYKDLLGEEFSFKPLYEEFVELLIFLSVNENRITYFDRINKLNLKNPFWWEEAKTLKELKIK